VEEEKRRRRRGGREADSTGAKLCVKRPRVKK